MNFLRIIDQTLNGAESAINFPFEGDYRTIMKTTAKNDGENYFDRVVKEYIEFNATPIDDLQKITGFVVIEGKLYAILTHNVVYIVNANGKTVERIYGLYEKH